MCTSYISVYPHTCDSCEVCFGMPQVVHVILGNIKLSALLDTFECLSVSLSAAELGDEDLGCKQALP